jgi:hypothetical protein
LAAGLIKVSGKLEPNAASGDERILRCRPYKSGVEIQVQTAPGFRYLVRLLSPSGETEQRRFLDGAADPSLVFFDGPVPNRVLAAIERLRE